LQCLNLRGRDVTCTRCADICSTKALDLTADEVRLDPGRCTDCGACLPVCPTGAFLMTGFDPQQFLQTVAGHAEIHIHCSRSDDPDAKHIVPCLQILDARLLAAAAADGVKIVVLHGRDHCSNCVRGDARAALEKIHADLIQWFGNAPIQLKREDQEQTETQERLGEKQELVSRRNFLRFAGAHVAQGTSRWLADVTPVAEQATSAGATSHWPVSPQDKNSYRPCAYQDLLAERAGALPWQDHRLPWRAYQFSEACNACLTCVRHCPTRALTGEETQATISIWFKLSQCTGCGLCERLCPESAVSSASVANFEELNTAARRLVQRSLRQCTDCARSFVPGPDGAERCTICHNERTLTNDWLAMLTQQ